MNYNNNGNNPAIGAINVAAGTLQVDSGNVTATLTNPLGNGNTITLGSVGSATLGLWGNAGSGTYNNPIVIAPGAGASNGTVTINDISGPQTLSGAISFPTSGTNTLDLVNSNNNGGLLLFSGGIAGTGNVLLQLTGGTTSTSSIQSTTNAINNIGTVSNTSTTTSATNGGIIISGGLGANVTGLIQNSAVVPMTVNTVASPSFAGSTSVLAGTLNVNFAAHWGTRRSRSVAARSPRASPMPSTERPRVLRCWAAPRI